MKIGIAIPSYYKDKHYLNGLIKNISQQTVKPDAISISMSQVENFEISNDYGLNIQLTLTTEPKSEPQNRNIAASKLNTEIISFIDVDDFMHPQRTEFLLEAFDSGATAVLHNYEPSSKVAWFDNTMTLEEFMSQKYQNMEFHFEVICNLNSPYPYPIWKEDTIQHNAHLSVLKKIFDLHKYDNNGGWGADSPYNSKLVAEGYKISYINNKLSWYQIK